MSTAPLDELEEWRQKIDDLDRQLVKLLNDRARFAAAIGHIKILLGLNAYSPEREEEIIRNVTRENEGPLPAQAMRRLFERIIDESRAVERTAMNRKKNKPSEDS